MPAPGKTGRPGGASTRPRRQHPHTDQYDFMLRNTLFPAWTRRLHARQFLIKKI